MNSVIGKTTQQIRHKYSTSPEVYKAFAAGFSTGQAEKVHLGCCQAAMFRPSPEYFEWHLEEVEAIAEVFGLKVTVLDSHCPETPYEIWISRDKVGKWLNYKPNSEEWHQLRANACGILPELIDLNYHLREGYGKKCD